MAFFSVLFRCYITFILTQWKGNSPAMVSATSSGADEPPTNLTASTLTSTSIRVTWDPPEFATADKIITYNVSYDAPESSVYGNSTLTNDTIVVLGNLKEGIEYFIIVEAMYDGITCGSAQVNATTAVAPDSVANVSVPDENISPSTITVNWMKLGEKTGFTISYIVFYQPVSGPYGPIVSSNRRRRQLNQEFTMNFTEPPGTLTNLNGSVTYRIQVVAVACALNQKLIGNRSMAVMVTTSIGIPTLPRELSHGDLTKNSIFIMWQRLEPPNGLIQMYTVSYAGSLQYFDQEAGTIEMFTSNNAKNISVVNESSSSINITDLRVGTEYLISVVAFTSVGPGASANISVSTLPDAPPDPPALQVSETTDTTAAIEIQQGSDINGPIRYFAVIVAIGSNACMGNSDTASINIGPYDEAEANRALSNGQSYAYIAGLVMISEINDYPHSYALGDESTSSNGGVNYVNVPLQANTQYAVVIRAHTADDLFADSDPITVTTTRSSMDDSENNSSLSTGVVAVIAAVSSCIVSVVITAIITFVITAHYYKRKYSNKQTAVTQSIVSGTDEIEYEEITKISPDNMAMTANPSYDVAMIGNPAYGHNVKKIDQASDYYN